MPSQSLSEQFEFNSRELVWRELRALVSALDARFTEVEGLTSTFDAEVDKFQELGLQTLNETITPLVEEAINKLTSVADIFSVQSTTENDASLGGHQFVVTGDERLTFAPLAWVAIYANDQDPVAGMIARVEAWDPVTGTLVVDATIAEGDPGPYQDWTITTSAPPSGAGVSQGQVDSSITALYDSIVGDAPGGLDTLEGIAASINNQTNYAGSVTTALAGKQNLANALTALAVTGPVASHVPYYTSGSASSSFLTSSYMRSIMNTADVNALKAIIAAPSLSVEDQVVSGGASVSVKDLGTKSSGTVTPDPGDRPIQKYTNGGAHTLAPGSVAGSYLLDIVNNATAGAVTTTGWTKVVGSFTTTNGHKFRCSCSITADGSLLIVQAMQ